jgi:hypothetical protein
VNEIKKYQIVPAAETVFVISAEAGIQLFRSGPPAFAGYVFSQTTKSTVS